MEHTIENCAVYFTDKIVSYVNPKILDKQNAWDKLDDIKILHIKRYGIFEEMKATNNSSKLHALYKSFMKNETDLQALWGFEENPNYIKFWDVPHCTCPRSDNEDNYPHGPYVYDTNCKVHS